MIGIEAGLATVQVVLLLIYRYLFGYGCREMLRLMCLALGVGGLSQALLGPRLNLYTPNVTLYLVYVSVAVLLAWGVGLMLCHVVSRWLAKKLGWRYNAWLFTAVALCAIVVLEVIGSNVMHMKLHDHARYPPLLPALNAMHAPPWLYLHYFVSALLFHALARHMEHARAREAAQSPPARIVSDSSLAN